METERDEPITGIYEVLDAVEAVIYSADAAKRQLLAEALDAYHEDFPDDFHWAVGASSPALLANLMMTIDVASRSDQSKRRTLTIRWGGQETEGNA